MALQFMFITNDPRIAHEAERAGIDRIFVDLELNGKRKRQGHLDTHISNHTIEDIIGLKEVLHKSSIITRINPIYPGTKEEIDKAIRYGTDILMLPMFKTKNEAASFISLVDKRAKTCLLLETAQALVRVYDIIEIPGIDEVHIGLNDLHLALGLDFMFELLSGGIIEYLSQAITKKGIKFGFGGIARIGEGQLPAENIIGEHVRLGSEMVILSRSFHQRANSFEELTAKIDLRKEIEKIRKKEEEIRNWSNEQFEINALAIQHHVQKMVQSSITF